MGLPSGSPCPSMLMPACWVTGLFMPVLACMQDTMYHSFFQHLLLRLPPRLADHVVALLGQFATGVCVCVYTCVQQRQALLFARSYASSHCLFTPLSGHC